MQYYYEGKLLLQGFRAISTAARAIEPVRQVPSQQEHFEGSIRLNRLKIKNLPANPPRTSRPQK
ncbi:hypothetical protein [Tychonema sp. LEGE 07203]|uniref:hypothetical protein n=1 Tax=Tychonema sp. LEGE 07203 TaxID=1828671 RepID=UPI001882DFF3|nr:hypothetical protein [Tychonema sp. LEGE 07203]MBE9097063.1 hypothetical protein [Tychonema sp. LEGE 07203]